MIKNKRIVITGGSGFIGTNAVGYFSDNNEVLNLDCKEPRNKKHIPFWRKVNILDKSELGEIIKTFDPHFFIHLAATTDLFGKSIDYYEANTTGVENVNVCLKSGVSIERVIFTSTKLVCKNGYTPTDFDNYCPDTLYGKSKEIGEKIIKNDSAIEYSWIIIRPTSIWGPWFEEPYRKFFEYVQKRKYVHINKEGLFKSYGYVGNIIFQIERILLSDHKYDKDTFFVSDYDPIEIGKWADLISKCYGVKKPIRVPVWPLSIAAKLGDLSKIVIRNPPLTSFRLNNILTEAILDLSKTKEVCGNLPYSVENGVEETVEFLNGSY
ncbi:MAG TPA: NAD-dependent epimerase/dehydratase family protein [Thermotogota bacterium]|nr:NAD-dependent epimerase/dehydratase family protein [Thermotogota bacterium]